MQNLNPNIPDSKALLWSARCHVAVHHTIILSNPGFKQEVEEGSQARLQEPSSS